VTTAQQVDAKKSTVKGADALRMVSEVDEIYATKGKQVLHFDLRKETPDAESLKAVLLGPTGNLRAPTLRKGRVLMVGFDEAAYRKLFS